MLLSKPIVKAIQRKRVLIVNCYADDLRLPLRQPSIRPQAMAPAYLAGVFSARHCEIKLFDEVSSGPLESETILSWPDMLVLTGLNVAFDRMLHLTAYARTKNPHLIVVAGGPAIRALKKYVARSGFFNYACVGDIEQIAEVIRDAWDESYLSEIFLETGWAIPRYDLVYWMSEPTYVEASRNCYYHCTFCSLTAEKHKYKHYEVDYIRAQFNALGKQKLVFFLDNNFYSKKKMVMEGRFSLLNDLKTEGAFWRWGALVTNDFFLSDEYLTAARESGCLTLFSGIESFSRDTLIHFRKEQNTRISQFDAIEKCLDNGIAFLYGLMFDIAKRPISELEGEIELILDHPNIPLPCYWTLAIPLLGTPLFYEVLDRDLFLPNVKIRDMDGKTIIVKSIDPVNEVVDFVRRMQRNEKFGTAILGHLYKFWQYNRSRMGWDSMCLNLIASNFGVPYFLRVARDWQSFAKGWFQYKRAILASEEPLDDFYYPKFRVNPLYERYFRPTMLTNNDGKLVEDLHEDMLTNSYLRNRQLLKTHQSHHNWAE